MSHLSTGRMAAKRRTDMHISAGRKALPYIILLILPKAVRKWPLGQAFWLDKSYIMLVYPAICVPRFGHDFSTGQKAEMPAVRVT